MIKSKTAELLARLERYELDSLRQDLARVDAEISSIEQADRSTRVEIAGLMDRRGVDVPFDTASALGAGLGQKRQALAARMQQVQDARSAINEVLMAKLMEVKRWEKVGEQSVKAERLQAARREQALMDDIAQNRRLRHKSST